MWKSSKNLEFWTSQVANLETSNAQIKVNLAKLTPNELKLPKSTKNFT